MQGHPTAEAVHKPRLRATPPSLCPCCRAPLPPTSVAVNLDINVMAVGWRQGIARLTPHQAELVSILAAAMPRTVPYDIIVSRLWGLAEPADPLRSLYVLVFSLRRKLRPLGLLITTIRNFGFVLVRS